MASDSAIEAASKLIDRKYGIIQNINLALSLPDEPAIYTAEVERSHPEEMTDGHHMEPHEGGCSLDKEQTILSAIGEAVERYCACIYRDESIRRGRYEDVGTAVNPDKVINFSNQQVEAGEAPSSLYNPGESLGWVEATQLGTSSKIMVPAQLVYLNYDRGDEPFVRNPISTGLAASTSVKSAIDRGILEVVERDAFMIYYLTKSGLPHIILDEWPEQINTLTDRIERAGLNWYLLDARTDVGLPTVIAIIVADEAPTVTVAAAASASINEAVRDALEEALQVRIYQRHLVTKDESPVDLTTVAESDIGRDTRLQGWAKKGMENKISFWTESDQTISFTKISDESDLPSNQSIPDVVSSTLDQYVIELTTRDVAECGFSVIRAIAPDAHPLYLNEKHQYLDQRRLQLVPRKMGVNTSANSTSDLNTFPHPFS